MKITCTLQEYTKMIRMCKPSETECRGCVMVDICGMNMLDDAVEFEIKREEEIKEGS